MTTDNASQEARQLTAGERLRKARESAGLSVAEVADKQHLRPAVVTAIENGDYQQIDSELFLKGYVRAYAAHVGVNADSVVRQLDRELEPLRQEKKAQVEANPLVTIERRKRRKKRIARIIVLLLALAAFFYAGSLYLTSQQDAAVEEDGPDDNPAPDDGAVPENDGSPAPETGLNVSPAAPADPSTSAPITSTSVATDSDSGLSDKQNGNGTGSDSGPGNGPAGLEPVEDGGRAADDSPESGALSATTLEPGVGSSEPPPESEPAQAAGGRRLIATFSDDCWVEVRDANGRTLVAALRRAGETLNVRGEPPLQVVFGAVDAVASVEFAGEEVDLSSRPARNNRVALTLTF